MKFQSRLSKLLTKPSLPPLIPEAANTFFYLFTDESDENLNDFQKAENTTEKIENKAAQDAATMKAYPALLPPWMRDWVKNAPMDEVTSFRRDWHSCALSGSVQNAALNGWENNFAAMGKEFLDRTDGWKNIVQMTFGGVTAPHYKEDLPRGGAAYYEVPASIMALAPVVSVHPAHPSVSATPPVSASPLPAP